MAIDTRQKRMSVPGCGRPWLRSQDNDATLAQGWRQSVGNIYSGNLVGGAAPPSPIDPIIVHYYRKLLCGGTLGGTT